MTVIGSGNANSASRSTGPWVGIPARRSSAIWAIRGSRAVTDRGVKACATSRRKRVWSGGSVLSMWDVMSERSAPGRFSPGWAVATIRRKWWTSLRIVGSPSTCFARL